MAGRDDSPPPLGSLLGDGAPSQVLLINDLAVSPSSRGLGGGQKLIRRAFDLAARDGLGSAELIAIEGAAEYWPRLGFIEERSRARFQKSPAPMALVHDR